MTPPTEPPQRRPDPVRGPRWWKQFRARMHEILDPVDDRYLYAAAVICGAMAMMVPTIDLLLWKKKHILLGLSWLLLTPIFATAGKVALMSAAYKRKDWFLIGFVVSMLVAATMELLSLARMTGIRVPL